VIKWLALLMLGWLGAVHWISQHKVVAGIIYVNQCNESKFVSADFVLGNGTIISTDDKAYALRLDRGVPYGHGRTVPIFDGDVCNPDKPQVGT
jgi:hypothetical protein